MLRSHRLIFFVLFPLFLITACVAQTPSTPMVAITPTSAATATSTLLPTAMATSIPASSPSPTISFPTFDSIQPVAHLSLAASERILDMVAEPGDNIWLITDLRVLHYSNGTWNDYLSQFKGTLIGMDSAQHVWVTSDDGVEVSVWNGSVWSSLGPETGWKPLPVLADGMEIHWSIATDAHGQVWLANERDIRMFDGAGWEVFDLEDMGMLHPVYEDTLFETSITFLEASSTIWVTSCYWIGPGPYGGGGARWYDGNAWQGLNSPVADGCATVVNEDRLGNIWLGLENDLWRLNALSGNWERFPAPDPPEGNHFGFFTDLALDTIGNPWPELAICGGASCGTGFVRYHVSGAEWLQIDGVGFDNSSLYFDAMGQGWVFTPDQVFRIAQNQLEPVAELSILKVAVDLSGRLWIIGIYEDETILLAQT